VPSTRRCARAALGCAEDDRPRASRARAFALLHLRSDEAPPAHLCSRPAAAHPGFHPLYCSLWHLIVIEYVSYGAKDYMLFTRVNIAIQYVFVVAIAFALSYLSFVLVEKPFMNLEGQVIEYLAGSRSERSDADGSGMRGARRGGLDAAIRSGVRNPELGEPLINPLA